ncbi:MAG: DUF4998 domain-containing protein [Sphingobacterium sp.]|nr:DUF4998 domain-containing protein [Sphingobacterium sp.]
MKNLKRYIFPSILLSFLLTSCHKWDEYKDALPEGSKVYPGIDTAIIYQAGYNKARLVWKASPDQRVAKYAVYWNNRKDSVVLDAVGHDAKDTIKALLENLSEGFYTFIIHSYDSKGRKSVPVEKNNVRIYGPIYQKSLLNRDPKSVRYDTDTKEIDIDFNVAEEETAYTELSYIALNNNTAKIKVPSEQSTVTIKDRKKGAKIYYQSYYKPTQEVIELFSTVNRDSIIIAD